MHLFGAFELDIRLGTLDNLDPQSCPPALHRARGGAVVHHSGSVSLEELGGQINSLQDELDEIRERARRAFQIA